MSKEVARRKKGYKTVILGVLWWTRFSMDEQGQKEMPQVSCERLEFRIAPNLSSILPLFSVDSIHDNLAS